MAKVQPSGHLQRTHLFYKPVACVKRYHTNPNSFSKISFLCGLFNYSHIAFLFLNNYQVEDNLNKPYAGKVVTIVCLSMFYVMCSVVSFDVNGPVKHFVKAAAVLKALYE